MILPVGSIFEVQTELHTSIGVIKKGHRGRIVAHRYFYEMSPLYKVKWYGDDRICGLYSGESFRLIHPLNLLAECAE